jgi:hypothetical protein
MNYTCIAAAIDNSSLQTPQQTISSKQGTCEDLSILLCSLLSNAGLTSYLAFTDKHVYAMVSGVNADDLWQASEQLLIQHTEEIFGQPLVQSLSDTYELIPNKSLFDGPTQYETFAGVIKSMTIDYNFNSNQQLTLFVVSSWEEFYKFSNNDLSNFQYIERWNFTSTSGTIPNMTTFGGIIIYNPGPLTTDVIIESSFTFKPSFYDTYNKNALTIYNIWGNDAVLLDPTLGEFGFPGYDAQIVGQKTAINPQTQQYFTLQEAPIT